MNMSSSREFNIVILAFLFLSSDTRNLTELIAAILQRVGDDIDRNNLPQILVFVKYDKFWFIMSF